MRAWGTGLLVLAAGCWSLKPMGDRADVDAIDGPAMDHGADAPTDAPVLDADASALDADVPASDADVTAEAPALDRTPGDDAEAREVSLDADASPEDVDAPPTADVVDDVEAGADGGPSPDVMVDAPLDVAPDAPCPSGQARCGDACVATQDDPGNCGTCGRACSSTNGVASCVMGVCRITCNAGFADCNRSAADGCEANLITDRDNCGACGYRVVSAGRPGEANLRRCEAGRPMPAWVPIQSDRARDPMVPTIPTQSNGFAVWTGRRLLHRAALATGASESRAYDPDTDTWRAVTEFGRPRGSSAVSLPDRNAVLTWDGGGATAEAFVFHDDGGMGTARAVTGMPPARRSPSLSYDGNRVWVLFDAVAPMDPPASRVDPVGWCMLSPAGGATTPSCAWGGAGRDLSTCGTAGHVNAGVAIADGVLAIYGGQGTDDRTCPAGVVPTVALDRGDWGTTQMTSFLRSRSGHLWLSVGPRIFLLDGFDQELNDRGYRNPQQAALFAPNGTVTMVGRPPSPAVPAESGLGLFTGRSIVVWGGVRTPVSGADEYLAGGSIGLVNGASVEWAALPPEGAPSPRAGLYRFGSGQNLWSGREVLVWGGFSGTPSMGLLDGARYQPPVGCVCPTNTDAPSWTPTPCRGVDDATILDRGCTSRLTAPCTTPRVACGVSCVDTSSDAANCGRCGNVCPAGVRGRGACVSSACTLDCDEGYTLSSGACVPIPIPRPVAPLHGSLVTTLRPSFQWELTSALTDGARVEVCFDRACTMPAAPSFNVSGTRGAPPADLPAHSVLFWRLSGRSGARTGVTNPITWEFTTGAASVGARDAAFQHGLRDVNRDGVSDVVVGTSSGRMYLYLGARGAGLGSPPGTPTSLVASGAESFPYGVLTDVNSDGHADFILFGQARTCTASPIFVYRGRPTGLPAAPDQTLMTTEAGPCGGGEDIGDVDGDGFRDVVANNFDANRVYVYRGSSAGLLTPPTILRSATTNSFGYSAGAGDVNGDGYSDLIVGAPASSSPSALVFRGGPGGLATTPAQTIPAPDTCASYPCTFGGGVKGVGDVNRDGYADVVISAWTYNTSGTRANSSGRAYLYLGRSDGLASIPAAQFNPPMYPGAGEWQFGINFAVDGTDLNADGYADIIIAAPGAMSEQGRAFVYLGGPTGPSTTHDVMWNAPSPGYFGGRVVAAGDVNADGFGDVAIAAPQAFGGTGRAYVFHGGMSLTVSPSSDIAAPSGSMNFGAAFAAMWRLPAPRALSRSWRAWASTFLGAAPRGEGRRAL